MCSWKLGVQSFGIAWCESCDLDFDLSCRKQTIDRSPSTPPHHTKGMSEFDFVFGHSPRGFMHWLLGYLMRIGTDIFIRFPDFSVQFLRLKLPGPRSGAPDWAPYTKSSRKSHFGNSRMQDVYHSTVSISKNATKSKNLHAFAYLFPKSGKNTSNDIPFQMP